MSKHDFLSPEWVDAARQVRDEYADRLPAMPVPVRANVTVTDAPFADAPIEAFIDTTSGSLTLDLGHLDQPELTIRLDYATARRIFVERDPGAAMEAFLSGRIVVEGDLAKMMALQTQAPDPVAEEFATRIADLTQS